MNIKIEIKIKNNAKLLANANLMFLTEDFGWITVKDFQIWSSNLCNRRLNEFINIEPPSIRVAGKYMKRIYIEDLKQWEKIEKLIFNAYKEKQSELAPIIID